MKCISCGAEIGLTDEKCPYCGCTVTETAGYQADLKTYKDKNEKKCLSFPLGRHAQRVGENLWSTIISRNGKRPMMI